MEKMLEKGKDIKGLKKTISNQAKIAGLKFHTEGEKEGLFKIFQKVYFSKVKSLLGFDQCTHFLSAAAPIDKKVVKGEREICKKIVVFLDLELLFVSGYQDHGGVWYERVYRSSHLPGKIY